MTTVVVHCIIQYATQTAQLQGRNVSGSRTPSGYCLHNGYYIIDKSFTLRFAVVLQRAVKFASTIIPKRERQKQENNVFNSPQLPKPQPLSK